MITGNAKELYACSYKEVITILCFLPDEDWNKIPRDEKDFYFKAMNRDYDFEYDLSKPLEEQKLLEPTKAILANIFKKYLATDEEKRIIFEVENQDFEEIEAEKSTRYPVEDLFNRTDNNINNQVVSNPLPVEVNKPKSIFDKILDFINKLLQSLE